MTSETVRERLLAAAVEVFVERGYAGAGTSEIARRAGLSVGAIYSQFGTKAELLGHAIAAHIPGRLAELFAAESPETAVALFAELARALPAREPEHGAMLIESFAAARRDPDVATMLTGGIRRRTDELASAIGLAQSDESVPADLRAGALAHFCMTVVLGSLVMNALDLPRPEPDEWAAVIDHLIRSVLETPREAGPPVKKVT